MNYSFVIPVANDNRLFHCIDSFLEAEHSKDCECVIVCNGTDDKFFEDIVKRYENYQNIHIIRAMRPNIALARNLGIIFATREYIVWLDSDCVLDSHYITNLMKHHQGEDIIRGNLKFNSGSGLLERSNAWLRSLYYDRSAIWCWTPNLVIKRDVYNEVGLFFEGVSGAEDGEWDWRARDFNFRPAKYCLELMMEHDADLFQSVLKSWKFYGHGQAYRLRRDRVLKNLSFDKIIRYVFSDLSFLRIRNGLFNNIFLICYTLIKAVAFVNSWFFIWLNLTRKKVIDQENFLRSSALQDVIKQEVKYAK